MSKPYTRRQYLISKRIQFKYMALVLGAIVLLSTVIGLSIYFTHWSLLNQELSGPREQVVLAEAYTRINFLLWLEVPLILIAAAFASLILSHKVAGPVYRLEKSAKEVARGNLSQYLHLRKNDELQGLAAAFNSVIDNMQCLVDRDRKLIFELSEVTNNLYTSVKDNKISQDEALVLIRKLNDLIGELRGLIMQYKTAKS